MALGIRRILGVIKTVSRTLVFLYRIYSERAQGGHLIVGFS